MHLQFAITTISILLYIELRIVAAETDLSDSTEYRQCSCDEHCADISYCPDLIHPEGSTNESAETGLSRCDNYRENMYELFCGMDWKTGDRKFCCRISPENKINTPGCGFPMENRITIPTHYLFENSWMVLIRDRNNQTYCSGTVIAGSFILTAASCSHLSTGGDPVRVGEFDILSPVDCSKDGKECAEPPIYVALLTFLRHPEYNKLTRENDIALLKIVQVQFSESVKPICLLSKARPHGSIVGWNSSELKPSKTLVSVVDAENCSQTIEGYTNGTRTMNNKLCVRMELSWNCEDPRRYTLPGSSFQTAVGQGGTWVQQGILLETSRCGKADRSIYAVMANVTSYMDWVQEAIHYIYPKMRSGME